jgi:CRP/FNR family transcriptional regulator
MSCPNIPPLPSAAADAQVVRMRDLKAHCLHCGVRELCLPVGINREGLRQIDALITERAHFRKGDPIYRAGDPFSALHALRVGSCKTIVLGERGHEQVTGYHMMGDIVGMDGIGTDRHCADAVALEDTEVCLLPFGRVEELARQVVALQRNLHKVMSAEIAREHDVMLMLGSMAADERLAAFLLGLSQRYVDRGYSATEFVLRLTREDIGSYLGLKLETVSRLLSRFQSAGLIQVQGRAVKLIDLRALKQMVGRSP